MPKATEGLRESEVSGMDIKAMPAPPRTMSDIAARLSNHDFEIHALGTRMGSVEGKVDRMATSMSMGFDEVKNLLSDQRATQGPGMKEVLVFVSAGGAIVGMAAAAITTLVTSFVTPEITTLKDHTTVLTKDHDARQELERTELTELRKQQQIKLEERLQSIHEAVEELQRRTGWSARIESARK